MAIQKKLKTNLVKLRETRTLSEEAITITETWTGKYSDLLLKQNASYQSAKTSTLSPTDAGEGQLVITYETPPPAEKPPEEVVELIWQELRLAVTEHPAFTGITAERKKALRLAADNEDKKAPSNELEAKLYSYLAKGVTEYAIGVPVVRRTVSRRTSPSSGGAWVRSSPPSLAPSGYQWLQTANETRKEGRTYTQTEEWTGAEEWDETLYP